MKKLSIKKLKQILFDIKFDKDNVDKEIARLTNLSNSYQDGIDEFSEILLKREEENKKKRGMQ